MEVKGIIKHIGETQKVSDKFQKREIVITTEVNTPYPQHVQFQVTQDKCGVLSNFEIGDEVKAQFNLRGREWNGAEGVKYFNTLEIWQISKEGGVSPQHQKTSEALASIKNDNDDLPF